MSRWGWKSSEGRTQAEQQQHQTREQARNRDRDRAAKQRSDQRHAGGRTIPQRGKGR